VSGEVDLMVLIGRVEEWERRGEFFLEHVVRKVGDKRGSDDFW
jgi:hypothetical protein